MTIQGIGYSDIFLWGPPTGSYSVGSVSPYPLLFPPQPPKYDPYFDFNPFISNMYNPFTDNSCDKLFKELFAILNATPSFNPINYRINKNQANGGGTVVPSSGKKMFSYTGSSQAIKREANAAGYFAPKGTYIPKRGDIGIWTKTQNTGHVGIVVSVDTKKGTVTLIEGNSGNKVSKNTYSLNNLPKNFSGFAKMTEWSGSERAEKAAKVAEQELAKGVRETNMKGKGSNTSKEIAEYKGGENNDLPWCAYFMSYCFHNGQNQLA